MKCKFVKETGEQCKAYSQSNSDYCWTHDPKINEEDKKAARVKGGEVGKFSKIQSKTPRDLIQIENVEDVLLLISDVINKLRNEEIEPRVANSISYNAGVIIKLFELHLIEKRLEVIEKSILQERKIDI